MNQPPHAVGSRASDRDDEALRSDERRPRSAAVERVVNRWFTNGGTRKNDPSPSLTDVQRRASE